ncbi:MAG: hypothetical protein U0236_12030 [Nitrospira sp.]
MSTDVLEQLIGRTVIRVDKVHDYLQLVLSGDAILSIFNHYQYSADSLTEIEGLQLLAVNQLAETISLNFGKGEIVLSVGMREDDYNGPEAMVLNRKDGPPVIWN